MVTQNKHTQLVYSFNTQDGRKTDNSRLKPHHPQEQKLTGHEWNALFAWWEPSCIQPICFQRQPSLTLSQT